MSIDNRIVRVGIAINDVRTWYEELYIEAKGSKTASTVSAECDITIIGLNTETRNFILRETRPDSASGKKVTVELQVGRVSYGYGSYYIGDVYRSEATPKPDLGIMLKCKTGYYQKYNIIAQSAGSNSKLSDIAATVAKNNGVGLSFDVVDRNIKSYSFTGSARNAVNNLADLANAQVFIDDNTLFVKDQGKIAKGRVVYNVSDETRNLLKSTGTEDGAKFKMIFEPSVNIGSNVRLTSELNPQLDGLYNIQKLGFHITNRAQPFFIRADGVLVNEN